MHQEIMPIQTLFSTMGLVLLMELGDKTMFTTMCLAAQYRRPKLVLAATMLALATSSVIAIIIGFVLSTTLPVNLITWISGALFVVLGIFTLVRANSGEVDSCDNPGTLFGMFSLVLVSELGDKSQITILALAAQTPYSALVFVGSLVAFLAVNSLGAFAGEKISSRIPLRTVKIVVGAVFIIFGALIIIGFL